MTDDQLIPPPANPNAPPKWLVDMVTSIGQNSERPPHSILNVLDKLVQSTHDWTKVPSAMMQGTQPETPGTLTEEDQFRANHLANQPYEWGPKTAMSEVFYPRTGRNVGGSGYNVGSGAIIPFPKQGGKEAAPKSTMDMLRDLFSGEKPPTGPSADVVPFTPALTAKQQGAAKQAAVEGEYKAPTPQVEPKLQASRDLAKQNWGPRAVTPEVQAEKELQANGFEFSKPEVNPQTKNMRQDFFPPEATRKQHPHQFEMETNPQTGNTLVRTNIVDKDRTLAVDIPFASRQEAMRGIGGLFSADKPPGFLTLFKYAFAQKQQMGVKLGKDVLDLPKEGGGGGFGGGGGGGDPDQGNDPRNDTLRRMGWMMGPPGDKIGQGMIHDDMQRSQDISDAVPRRGMNPFASGVPDHRSNTRDVEMNMGTPIDPYRLSPNDLRKYLGGAQ